MGVGNATRVGLVMCNHNRGPYLREAIDSVINQTFTDWQLVIWDNASTDKSRSVLEQIRDDRISVVYGTENNFPHCQHHALYSLNCEYLGIVDSDDRMLPDCLEKTVGYLDGRVDVGMVFTHYVEIDHTGDLIQLGHRCKLNYTAEYILNIHIVFHFKLFRKTCHDAIGGIDKNQRLAVDWDFALRFSEQFTIECLPIVLYEHRKHRDSVSQSRSEEQGRWSIIAKESALVRRGRS